MGTQGTGRKRNSNKERSTAEDDALNLIAREAEARLAAKRAARAEAREIRMRELERQQKEIFQVQKKYYGLNPKSDDRSDSKWGDIEQWMEDSERYSRPPQPHTLSDDDERTSVGSRGSARSSSSLSHKSKKKKKHKHKEKDRNGHDDEYGVLSSRASYASSDSYSLNGLPAGRNPGSSGTYQSSLYEDGLCSGSRRLSGSNFGSHPLEYSGCRSSNSRTSSRANSARTSPAVSRPHSLPASHEMQPPDNAGSVASLYRSTSSSRGLPRDLDDVTIPDFSDVDDRDYLEKGSRAASALTPATLSSLGGTSSRRASVETAITVDAETATREIKEIHELKDQIQDVESKYNQNLKEVKEALTEVEEKYRKAMVSNAQLDNEKNNLMYQVDTLKDSLTELEELLSESRREYEEKVKDFEREKHAHSVLQFQFNEMKETLKQSEELLNEIRQLRLKQEAFAREISDLQETVEWKDKKIGALERQKEYTDAIRTERDELREEVVKLKDILKKHGIVLGPDLSLNGDSSETETDVATSGGDAAPQQAQASPTSPSEGNGMLEIRLRKLVDEREKMIEQMKKLKAQVDQKSQKNGTDGSWSAESELLENGNDPNIIELQRDSSRQISDMKFKLVKTEQEVTALEQNVSRLEGQVSRYKSAAENAEKVEDELKAEKRKLQRELRSALDKVDELESNNSHLNKRLEKMKSSRGMAQTP
ncbi:leucine-rich repeat flightless-interacting protein 2 isoform X17 [Hippocampus zosterae]|uniref:leucine-rich repeat flightless-interacting protein 2 isoform X17 n=1 Tax=Hippocampus zosterae TaxID=109293 RepID=UPI00223D0E4C|nr:leucine-rich repeat flightless-interacting protein 2 isoform X17 [Hippocampus zosterae]